MSVLNVVPLDLLSNSSVSSLNPQKAYNKSSLKGLFYGFSAATCYGFLVCSIKLLYTFSPVSVFEILYFRSFSGIIMVCAVLYIINLSIFDVKPHTAKYLAIRCIAGFMGFVFELFSFYFTDLSKVVIILYNPFLASLMGYLLIQEKVTKHDLIAFFVGVIGVALLTNPFSNYKGWSDMIGIALAFLSAVVFQIGFIALRKVKKDLNSWHIVYYFQLASLIGCPWFMVAQNIYETKPRVVYQFELQSGLLLLFIGLVSVAGNYCINKTL